MSDIKWLAGELNDDVAALNDQQYTDVTEVKTLLNEEERAGIVVKALLNKVEQDAEELKTFVDILKKKPQKFKSLITKLDTRKYIYSVGGVIDIQTATTKDFHYSCGS